MSNKTKHVRVSTETHKKLKTEAASNNTSMTLLLEKKLSEEAPEDFDDYSVTTNSTVFNRIAIDQLGRELTEDELSDIFEFLGSEIDDITTERIMELPRPKEKATYRVPPKETNDTFDNF